MNKIHNELKRQRFIKTEIRVQPKDFDNPNSAVLKVLQNDTKFVKEFISDKGSDYQDSPGFSPRAG